MSDIYDEYRDTNGCGTALAGFLALVVIVLVLCFTSCKTQQPIVQTVEVVRTETEVVRDTDIVVEPDSASIKALFECDSNYNVVLKDLSALQGERIKPMVNITHNDDGSISANFICKEDSLVLEVELRDKIIEQQRKEIEVLKVKEVPAYYKRVSTGFWILLAILIVIVGFKAYKWYAKIQSGGIIK